MTIVTSTSNKDLRENYYKFSKNWQLCNKTVMNKEKERIKKNHNFLTTRKCVWLLLILVSCQEISQILKKLINNSVKIFGNLLEVRKEVD